MRTSVLQEQINVVKQNGFYRLIHMEQILPVLQIWEKKKKQSLKVLFVFPKFHMPKKWLLHHGITLKFLLELVLSLTSI